LKQRVHIFRSLVLKESGGGMDGFWQLVLQRFIFLKYRLIIMSKEKIKFEMIKEFDENKPSESGILTQGMCNIINPRKDKLRVSTGIFTILSQFPVSGYSKSSKKALKYLRAIPNNDFDNQFLKKSKGKELEMEMIFFLATDYDKRDVDNFIKLVTDAFVDKWYDDDSQVKKIIAEKILVPDLEKDENPKLYEQIYVSARIL